MRFGSLILASLLLTLSTSSWAQYQTMEIRNPEIKPAVEEDIWMSPDAEKKVAAALIDLEVCQAQIKVCHDTNFKLTAKAERADLWWAQPNFVIGGMVVSFTAGTLFIATRCLTLCK